VDVPISTKRGDKGFTGLLGGRRVAKFHLRPETYGTVDELNAFLGTARVLVGDPAVRKILFTIQDDLFMIGSDLAASGQGRRLLRTPISQDEVDWLTRLSGDFESLIRPEARFVVYGGTLASSILDIARAVSRRAERYVARMKSRGMLDNPRILGYLNRLSDVLYLLARYEEERGGLKLKHPSCERAALPRPTLKPLERKRKNAENRS
jgi:cob(I)alamin adenosyltransferase